jgi:hypothetical protein
VVVHLSPWRSEAPAVRDAPPEQVRRVARDDNGQHRHFAPIIRRTYASHLAARKSRLIP